MGRVGAWLGRLIVLVLLVAGSLVIPPTGPGTASAAEPAPPLDACLTRGSFTIGQRGCPYPESPMPYGSIDSVEVVQVRRGVPFTLSFPKAGSLAFDTPVGQCGSLGCRYPAVRWESAADGIAVQDGCGSRDATCTLTFSPPLVGDASEGYHGMFARHFEGISAIGGTYYAFYVPPLVYPVRITSVGTTGRIIDPPLGARAYAVRGGSDPAQAACVTARSIRAAAGQVRIEPPPCIELDRDAGGFDGWLPVDSGAWTIVADPGGSPGATLRSRPANYRPTTVTPTGDDVTGTVVFETRPGLAVTITPRDRLVPLGGTTVVDVTVRSSASDGGWLEDLVFRDREVLRLRGAVEGTESPLRVVDIRPPVPPAGVRLLPDTSQTFEVHLQAVTMGAAGLDVEVKGQSDTSRSMRAAASGSDILVEEATTGSGEPPELTYAFDAGPGAADPIEGVVRGIIGAEVVVSLFAAADDGAECPTVVGRGVRSLGWVPVAIGSDGIGRFSRNVALDPDTQVFGVAATDRGLSATGECIPVGVAMPRIRVEDAEGREPTGKGTSELGFQVRLSGPTDHPVIVHVRTQDGTATAPRDYEALDTSVTIPAGETGTTVAVRVVADDRHEETEELTLTLSDPDGATIDPDRATATGTILDGGSAATGIDLRGTWNGETLEPRDDTLKYTVTIRKHDRKTGRWSGTVAISAPGIRTTKVNVSGRLKDGTLTLTNGTVSYEGSLTQRSGRLSATMTGRVNGRRARIRITRVGD
ncbi:MAG: hypothetical protein KF809_14570 [Chloroflexi bacterium]|nr:hypothetical protein [Chloroflexota bacterium]